MGATLVACGEAPPLPRPELRSDDCLRELSLERLEAQLNRCNAVVAAFPRDPAPLNDRYLLHTLADRPQAACQDIRQALVLARRRSQLDAQLRQDLQLRAKLCGLPAL